MDPTLYLAIYLGASLTNGTVPNDPPLSPENPMGFLQHGYAPTGRAAMGLSMGKWDVELGVGTLGKLQINRDSSQGEQYDTSGVNANTSEVDLRVRYNQPIGRWVVYGELGVAMVHIYRTQWTYCGCEAVGSWLGSKDWDAAPQIGAGVGYNLSEQWRITAGVTYTGMQDMNTTQLMIGGRYSFK